MNRSMSMVHGVLLRQPSSPQTGVCLSLFHVYSNIRNTRNRSTTVSPRFNPVPNPIRFYNSTKLASLGYQSSSSSSSPSYLLPPTVIYSDNHLLAVNKPAGWHSVPNVPKERDKKRSRSNGKVDNDKTTKRLIENEKCLLTHLQNIGLGGGSKKDFLVPLHRIDQPCTGVLLFGKTSKAASRITKVWKGKRKKKRNQQKNSNDQSRVIRGVIKDYLCVVPTSRLGAMEAASISASTNYRDDCADLGFPSSARHSLADGIQWNQLDGLMLRQSALSSEYFIGSSEPRYRQQQRGQREQYHKERLRKGRSVKIVRRHRPGDSGYDSFYDYNHDADNSTMRPVRVEWKIVHVPTIKPAYTLLLVRTSEGARHMVRALLAQVGDCPILGDVRYWKAGTGVGTHGDGIPQSTIDNEKAPLRDRSVALHAYGLYFDRHRLKLGSLDTFEFRAPVPSTWESYFGIGNHQLQKLL